MSAGGGQYTDRWTGFSVHRPDGWLVRVTNGVVTVCEEASALASAMFWPLRLSQPMTPAAVAQQFVAQWRAFDPTLQAWVARDDPLVLRTEAQLGGKTLDGLYAVATQAGNGLISGFQAPREQAQSLAPDLAAIAGSFSLVPSLPRLRFVEPVEGAFTVLYPQGWSIAGSVNRANPHGAAIPGFQAANGQASVQNWITLFSFVSSIWGMGMVSGQKKLKHVPAAELARTWVPEWLRKQAGPLTVEQVIDRPDAIPQMALELAKGGQDPDRYEVSSATLQFTQVRNGQPFRNRLGVAVQRSKDNGLWSMSMNPTAWTAMITSSMQAPAAEFDGIAPVLTGILDSFQKNPQWEYAELTRTRQISMQLQQEAMARLQQLSQTLSQTTDIITSGYWERQAIQDRAWHNWSNGFLGIRDVNDQGVIRQVPNTWARVFGDNYGTLHPLGWGENPGPGLREVPFASPGSTV